MCVSLVISLDMLLTATYTLFKPPSDVVRLWHVSRHAPSLTCPLRQYWNVSLQVSFSVVRHLTQFISLEYTSPESLPSLQTGLLQQIDSKADMWSLGMILHKILFFRLPYQYAADGGDEGSNPGDANEGDKMAQLEREIQSYSGSVLLIMLAAGTGAHISDARFKSSATLATTFGTRRLPRAYIVLLESLLNVNPFARPTCERVLSAIRERRVCLNVMQVKSAFKMTSLAA